MIYLMFPLWFLFCWSKLNSTHPRASSSSCHLFKHVPSRETAKTLQILPTTNPAPKTTPESLLQIWQKQPKHVWFWEALDVKQIKCWAAWDNFSNLIFNIGPLPVIYIPRSDVAVNTDLESKWPLVLIGRTFFWRQNSIKQRTNELQVYFSIHHWLQNNDTENIIWDHIEKQTISNLIWANSQKRIVWSAFL